MRRQFVMPNSPITPRQSTQPASFIVQWLAVVAFLLLLGWVSYSLITGATEDPAVTRNEQARMPLNAEQRKLSDDIGEQEKKYQDGVAAGMAGGPALRLLEPAIEQQKELLRQSPRAGLEQSVRLERLEAARDNERARLAVGRIAELEATAGQGDAEAKKLREMLQLQRVVNNSRAEARYKNFTRETQLAQTLEKAEAGPIHEKFVEAMDQARAAKSAQRWAEAVAAFGRARDAQAQLNQNYGRTQFADQPALDAIEAEIASLNAVAAAAEIDARETKGDGAAKLGRVQEAAGLYQAAYDLQSDLNVKSARSRFVSTERLAELEIKRQTVLSTEMMAAVLALDRAAAACLLKRQVMAAAPKISGAADLLARVETEFPKSRELKGTLKIKLAYLGLRHADIRQLQDQIYERLVPVPETKNMLMLNTELPQEVYAKVMSNNPSRNPGRTLPVDSVSWLDAHECCQRLSWLLGTRVRLPTEKEFRAAVGDGESESWSAETAGGRSQEAGKLPANAAGFSDLAGNLAEWLQPAEADAPDAPVAGGSYLDPKASLKTLRLVPTDKAQRARHVGFRVVVELAFD